MPLRTLMRINFLLWANVGFALYYWWATDALRHSHFPSLMVPTIVRSLLLPHDLIEFWMQLLVALAFAFSPAAVGALFATLVTVAVGPSKRRLQQQTRLESNVPGEAQQS